MSCRRKKWTWFWVFGMSECCGRDEHKQWRMYVRIVERRRAALAVQPRDPLVVLGVHTDAKSTRFLRTWRRRRRRWRRPLGLVAAVRASEFLERCPTCALVLGTGCARPAMRCAQTSLVGLAHCQRRPSDSSVHIATGMIGEEWTRACSIRVVRTRRSAISRRRWRMAGGRIRVAEFSRWNWLAIFFADRRDRHSRRRRRRLAATRRRRRRRKRRSRRRRRVGAGAGAGVGRSDTSRVRVECVQWICATHGHCWERRLRSFGLIDSIICSCWAGRLRATWRWSGSTRSEGGRRDERVEERVESARAAGCDEQRAPATRSQEAQ